MTPRTKLLALPFLLLLAQPAAGEELLSARDETLATAFSAIQERALAPVEIGPLAFDGVAALSTVDPAVKVEKISTRRLGLIYAGRLAAQYPVPGLNDADGWAAVAEHLSAEAKRLSPLARAAGDEQIRAAIMDGALSHLDRFSRYAPPAEAEEHRANRNGFGGIGVRLEPHDDDATLLEVLPGTPAAQAHLKAGDHILAVDGQPVGGLNQEAMSKLMRGPVDSAVSLTVRPVEQQKASIITLVRGHIVPPTVHLETVEEDVASITLSGFTEASDQEMQAALDSLRERGSLKGLILDLRGNPGGLLDKAVAIADLFIAEGAIVSTRGRHPDSLQAYAASPAAWPGAWSKSLRLAVLVDGRTASAAEILAAALQDTGRAVLIGTNSYGKGTVQTVQDLPNGGELTLTWSRYYAPSGYSLHELGVLPALCSQGASTPAEAVALLRGLTDSDNSLPSQLYAWRAAADGQIDLRKSLRLSCPGENRLADAASARFDQLLARRILAEESLYQRAIALSSTGEMKNLTGKTTSSP